MKSNIEDIEVVFQTRTERAICIRADEGCEDVWLPLSMVEIEGHLQRGSIITISAEQSYLEEKGLV